MIFKLLTGVVLFVVFLVVVFVLVCVLVEFSCFVFVARRFV